MKLNVIFKQVDNDFNKEYADEYHFGKESENNRKYNWEVQYAVDNTSEITLKENSALPLKGKLDNGVEIDTSIPNMNILECVTEDGRKSIFAVSNSLLRNIHKTQNPKYKSSRYYYYLKDETKFADLGQGIFVDYNDLPQEMKID